MIQEDLDSWEHFEERLRQLAVEREELVRNSAPIHVSGFLFRGHRDHNWRLETTLERVGEQPWSLSDYFELIHRAKPQIETFTGLRWDVGKLIDLIRWATTYDDIWKEFPAYDYLVYLRHHGFPSPLLDWTRSPYVAAYFAFDQQQSERVAIYAYMEYAGGGKTGSSGRPQIRSLGPYIRSHSRHFLQQSEYTFAAQFSDKWLFVCHEEVFSTSGSEQDRLWKFTVPCTERIKVLRKLDAYNLNAFSLFQTEEALLRTMAIKEIELDS